jgi:hypothetical protein
MNCQWQVHFETLRPSAFQAIGDCRLGHFFPESISADPFLPINFRRSTNLNSIADRTAREVARRLPRRPVEISTESKHRPRIFPHGCPVMAQFESVPKGRSFSRAVVPQINRGRSLLKSSVSYQGIALAIPQVLRINCPFWGWLSNLVQQTVSPLRGCVFQTEPYYRPPSSLALLPKM